jgi:hypothetical protein
MTKPPARAASAFTPVQIGEGQTTRWPVGSAAGDPDEGLA